MRVGVSEARRHWGSLLERVSKGEIVHITRRGVLVAKLVPADLRDPVNVETVVQEIRGLRKGATLGEILIRDLIDQGRRY